jgi:Flp pilus assembly protein TadG
MNRRRNKTERGASMVEFALLVPLFVMLCFGIMQFGMLFSGYISLRNAAAVGARYAALTNTTPAITPANVKTEVRAAISAPLQSTLAALPDANIDVNLQYDPGDGNNNAKRVFITYDFPLTIANLIPGQSGGKFTLTAESIMR